MSWHAPPDMLTRFATEPQSLSDAVASSIEQHMLSCAECRRAVASAISDAEPRWLADSWAAVVDGVDQPRAGLLERCLVRLGVPIESARLAAASGPMRLALFVSVVMLATVAVLASRSEDSVGPFLGVAPLVPLVGVAMAFSPIADPGGEAGRAAPLGGFKVLAHRTVAATVPSVLVTILASFTVPDVGVAWRWLLPGLALAGVVAALATWIRVHVAVGIAAIGWPLLLIVFARLDARRDVVDTAPFSGTGQIVAGLLVAATAAMVFARRDRFSTVEVSW